MGAAGELVVVETLTQQEEGLWVVEDQMKPIKIPLGTSMIPRLDLSFPILMATGYCFRLAWHTWPHAPYPHHPHHREYTQGLNFGGVQSAPGQRPFKPAWGACT